MEKKHPKKSLWRKEKIHVLMEEMEKIVYCLLKLLGFTNHNAEIELFGTKYQ